MTTANTLTTVPDLTLVDGALLLPPQQFFYVGDTLPELTNIEFVTDFSPEKLETLRPYVGDQPLTC